jgi:Tfp pilus assembly protein PilX
VLLVLILIAFVVFALLGLGMCHLAALSDENHALAVAKWIATSHLAEHEAMPAERPRTQIQFDFPDDAFHATG